MDKLLEGLAREPWLILGIIIMVFFGLEQCIRAWRQK